ncbi:MAG TPA: efflux RND transporter periplasmic adaptor subunit, partial [Bacteroidetes bacterium]|nr:efflux RND transporter periplasmic adaptor subunit [Bacteroidota bacterium]
MRTSLLILASVILSLSGCGKSTKPDENALPTTVKKIAVQVEPVQMVEIAVTHKITGEIAPLWKIDVFPKINGIVLREMTGPGSVVQKDQALAEMKQDVPGVEFSPVKINAPV